MCVCICTCMPACVTNLYVNCVCVYVHVCVCCAHVCLYMYVCSCMCDYVYMNCVCVCVFPTLLLLEHCPPCLALLTWLLWISGGWAAFPLLPWNVFLVQWFQPTVTSSTLKSSARVPYNSISPFSWNVSLVFYKSGFQVQTNREFSVKKGLQITPLQDPQPSYAEESLHLHGESPRKHSRKASVSAFPT